MSLPEPVTRKEQYLNEIATGEHTKPGYPVTREEMYLDAIAEGGSGGTGYETITGNPLEFDSPSPQIVGMKCDIVAQQDLHGYDKPWAGGADDNIAEPRVTSTETTSDITFTPIEVDENFIGVNISSGTVVGSNVNKSIVSFTAKETTSYRIIGAMLDGTVTDDFRTLLYDLTADIAVINFIVNNNLTVNLTADHQYIIAVYYKSGTMVTAQSLSIMVCKASTGITQFKPYSNICPISGLDEVSVTRCGKNYYDQSKAQINRGIGNDGTLIGLSGDNGYASDYMNVKPLTTYKYIATASGGAGAVGIAFYDSDKNVLSWSNINDVNANNYNITSPANAAYARCTMYTDDGHYGYFGLESIYTGLEPYQGETYTIDLDGTRYGGQLDVTTGELKVDMGYKVLSQSDQYVNIHGQDIELYRLKNVPAKANALIISDTFEGVSQSQASKPYQVFCNQNGDIIFMLPQGVDISTVLPGVEICYELATPQTIQLTPTQVWAVQGGNTITVSVDGVEAEVHSSNYATLKDIEILYNMIKGG